MATNTNKISAVLSDADKASILNFIQLIKKLLPFLLALTEKERKDFRKMGPKSVDYVNLNLQGAQNFPDTLPGNFDTDEFGNDVSLVNQLLAIQIPLASLLEGVNDTLLAAGSDSMMEADIVYGYLKAAAKNNAAVKGLVAQIAQRYAKQAAAHTKKADAAAPVSPK
jgi:hypothetical protein